MLEVQHEDTWSKLFVESMTNRKSNVDGYVAGGSPIPCGSNKQRLFVVIHKVNAIAACTDHGPGVQRHI